jgi:hypothetical protein
MVINMEIALIVLVVLFFAMLIAYINISRKLKVVSLGFTELLVSVTKINEFNAPNEAVGDDVHKESFIKFLSDSRDWAFEYIETVQKGLTTFVEKVDKDIERFDKYGDSVAMQPNYDSLKNISEAYKELKTLLPEDKVSND